LPLADIADRECRDGFSQPVIGRKHPVVAMPVLPRRRDQIGEPGLKIRCPQGRVGSSPTSGTCFLGVFDPRELGGSRGQSGEPIPNP